MNELDVEKLVENLKKILPIDKEQIALHEPCFGGNEWTYVKECIDTGWVSSVGKFVDRFEAQLAEYTGCKRVVAVVNGTAALHIALLLSGVQAGDEVLMPALTFIATANAVTYCGAVPHFVDSEYTTLGLDPRKLADYLRKIAVCQTGGTFNRVTGRRIKAVLPMHTFGHPVDLDSLIEVCQRYNLVLIEDAAESLGSYYKGKHTGNWGKLAALSFNGNKTVTTGGGGAIMTNDEELGKMAKHITTTAKIPHRWAFFHDQCGYNYRMPNINAALGCAQLEQLSGFIEKKRSLAQKYQKELQNLPGAAVFQEASFAKSNYWLNVLLLDKENQTKREQILEQTNTHGIMTRPVWTLMHKLPMFAQCPHMNLDVAEDMESRIINLPSSVTLAKNLNGD